MNIGDRFHVAPGVSSVVVVREIRDHGLVMVENETPGIGVYPYLTKPDYFVPAATEPPVIVDNEPAVAESEQSTAAASYLDELNTN